MLGLLPLGEEALRDQRFVLRELAKIVFGQPRRDLTLIDSDLAHLGHADGHLAPRKAFGEDDAERLDRLLEGRGRLGRGRNRGVGCTTLTVAGGVYEQTDRYRAYC